MSDVVGDYAHPTGSQCTSTSIRSNRKVRNTGIHRALIIVVLFGAIALRGAFADDSLRLPVTRDVWLSAAGREADDNLGGSNRLKLKSIQ